MALRRRRTAIPTPNELKIIAVAALKKTIWYPSLEYGIRVAAVPCDDEDGAEGNGPQPAEFSS